MTKMRIEVVDYEYPEEGAIANLYCPSIEWEETAKKLSNFRGAMFSIACPKIYRDEHFPSGVHVGQRYNILLDGQECICGARLESFESALFWNIEDRRLKGIFGVQFVEPLLQWFNSRRFIEEIGVSSDRIQRVSYQHFLDIAEFSIVVLATDVDDEAE